MQNILDRIVDTKKTEVAAKRKEIPASQLAEKSTYQRDTLSLSTSIRASDKYGLITEFKRKSPSQQDINLSAQPSRVARNYALAGAAGISCLTDAPFFGAQADDFNSVRQEVSIPVLRKDFIIDSYQIHESRAMGADAILLIAACLEKSQLQELSHEAQSIGLEVLCEIHSGQELNLISSYIDIIGVNNRNLKDFTVSIGTSLSIVDDLPSDMVRISESGIDDAQAIVRLRRAGYEGFLIGTHFMKSENPGMECRDFINRIAYFEDLYDNAWA